MRSADCQRCQVNTEPLAAEGEPPTTGALRGWMRVVGRAATHTRPQHLPASARSCCCSCHASPRASFNPSFPGHAGRGSGSRGDGTEQAALLRGPAAPGLPSWHTAALQIKGHCELTSLFQAGAGSTFLRLPLIRRGKPIFRQEAKQERTQSRGPQCPPAPAAAPWALM